MPLRASAGRGDAASARQTAGAQGEQPAVCGQDQFAISAFFSFFAWGVCSALAITACTFIDALLVGNLVGSDGLAVVNLATPVFLVYSLLGVTLGVGGNVLIGKQLGGVDASPARASFHRLLWLGLLVGLVCLLLCLPMQLLVRRVLGADAALMVLALAYLTPVFFAAPLFVLYHILSASVRTDGDPKRAAVAAAVVVLTNLSLDLLFMRVLGWGIRGASLSLCIAEALGTLVLLTHFVQRGILLPLGLKRPTWREAYQVISNGFGVGSILLFQGVVTLCFNALLLKSAQQGVFFVAVFGVFYTVSLLPWAFADGAGNALATVVAIFCGERDVASVRVVLRHALVAVLAVSAAFAALFALCAPQILALFGLAASAEVTLALQLFSASLLLTGVHAVLTTLWQTVGRARLAGGFSVLRNFVLMLGVGVVLIPRYQIVGVALSYLVVECLCFVLTCVVEYRRGSLAYLAQRFCSVHRTYEQYYAIQTQSMSQIALDIEDVCAQWEMTPRQSFFVSLIIEELVLNIMKFGLQDSKRAHYVAIKLLDNDGEYILRIRDNVKAYNPFDSQGDEVDVGAMRLITTKAQYYDYQRKLIFNYLYLIL